MSQEDLFDMAGFASMTPVAHQLEPAPPLAEPFGVGDTVRHKHNTAWKMHVLLIDEAHFVAKTKSGALAVWPLSAFERDGH